MPSRFVSPQTTTLKLSNGDTLTVKRRLNFGEQTDQLAAMASAPLPGETTMRANPFEIGIAMVLAYLLDWSLTDEDGVHVEIRDKPREEVRSILRQLDPLDFQEIRVAVETHVAAQDQLREAEKNGQGGGSALPATSPSLVAVAGGMSGSLS
jgi:hypothetical protein